MKNEIAFTKVKLPFGWLGNMAAFPVIHQGIQYKTTEALFQALRFEGYPDIQQKIISEQSPMSAKMVAKENVFLLEQSGFEMMGEKDVENMRLCIKLKLEQHPQLKELLLDTGDSVIIEDCSNRPQGSGVFWGAAKKNEEWFGKNILGNIWMDFRAELTNNLNNNESNNKKESVGYTFFFNLKSPFSNFHPSKIEYKDYVFCSNEQFMMFAKGKTFNDEIACNDILEINKNPLIQDFLSGKLSSQQIVQDINMSKQWNKLMMDIKACGRSVKNFREDVWSKKCQSVVLFGARLKFTQNNDLGKVLLATNDTQMVEASPYDKIWGIGLSENDAKKIPAENWPGKNLLGNILTKLKQELNNKNSVNITVGNFYHLNKTIPKNGKYIGRYNKNYNLPASIFANPFPMFKPEDRPIVIEKYTNWLWEQIAQGNISKKDLLELNNNILICYCAPQACHGNVLKDVVSLLIENEKEFDSKVLSLKNKNKPKP